MNIIGKKVRIIAPYPQKQEYVGKIGTIVVGTADRYIWEVKMPDGKIIMPYSVIHSTPQCEWVEESYRIEDIRNKKIAIECKSQQEWDNVRDIIEKAGIKTQASGIYKSYAAAHGYSTAIERMQEYCRTQWYRDQGYQIISSKQLITDNTNNMEQNKEVLEKIQKMEKELKELKESLNKPVYKVGQWVTCKPGYNRTGTYHDLKYAGSGYKENKVFMITKTKNSGSMWINHGDILWDAKSNGVYSHAVRPSTPDEIKKAQEQQPVTLPIGTGTHTVCVEKGKITGPESKDIDIEDIARMVNVMNGAWTIGGWGITIDKVKIGCVEGITLEQGQAIIDAYKKLNP